MNKTRDIRYNSSKDVSFQEREKNGLLVKVAYASGRNGFCISRNVIQLMADDGSKEAKNLLETTIHDDVMEEYWFPISLYNYQNKWSEYFYKNRDDPSLIKAIETVGEENVGEKHSGIKIAHVKLLPGEKYKVKFLTESAMAFDIDEEYVLVIDDEK